MPRRSSTSQRGFVLPAIVAGLLGIALFAGTAANGFVFDDITIVQKNPLVRDPAALGRILASHYWANVEPGGDLYRPLTIWSFALNEWLMGPSPAGFHVVNAVLHGAVSAEVVLLAGALGLSPGGALAAGLLFASHPVHVEAVAPVTGRSELLASLFALAAWLCHLAARRRREHGRSHPRRATALAAAAVGLFVAAALSKENALVLPALLLAGDLCTAPKGGRWRSLLAPLGGMVVAGILVLALRAAVIPGLPPGSPLGSVFGGVSAASRVMTAVGVLGRYLWLMIFPITLSADYSFHQIPLITSPLDPLFLASAAIHAALAAAGFVLLARRRLTGLGILVYLGALFPVSNILFSIGTVMGERLLYLPSAGLCLAVPALRRELSGRQPTSAGRTAAALAVGLVVTLFAARVTVRSADWKDQMTLFTATARTSPLSAKAHYNLGTALEDRGNRAAAMEEYRKAIAIKPDMVQALRNLGLDLLAEGNAAEAIRLLSEASRLDPAIPDVLGDLGVAYHDLGRDEEAVASLREELRHRPDNARALYNLGTILLQMGRSEEALESLTKAVELNPMEPDYRAQEAAALSAQGLHEEAYQAYEDALRMNPGLAELLVPAAREAAASGHEVKAREMALRARNLGVVLPEELDALIR